MLKRIIYIFTLVLLSKLSSAQCPQIYDYLGNLVNKPYFIDCQGTGSYTMNFASNIGWDGYTINWGDGTTVTTGGSYTANSLINHVYTSASPDTFVITLNIPSLGCTLNGLTVIEKPVSASIQIPFGGVTTTCASKALQFINSSTDVSKTTLFTWNFGDGTPLQTFNYTDSGKTISHTYNPGTVNCQTAVTLTAKNYCTSVPTIANVNPIQIYEKDDANITPSAFIKCWPDNVFTFTNTTNRNCVSMGNTFQRQEQWTLGNYWGLSRDSIISWRPWPPTSPLTIAFPSVGTYTVQLQDSNLCGVDIHIQYISVLNPPIAGVVAPSVPLCQDAAVTFTNSSANGYFYKWNFGTGGGYVSKPFGTQTFTYNASGTYTVSVLAYISGAGSACTDTAKVVVTILPRPIANFSVSPNQGCNAITGVTFTDLSTSAASWNWDFGNTNTFNGQTPPLQNYTSVGNYLATLSVTASNSCIHTFTVPIRVYQTPVAAFTVSNTCVGSTASFIDNSTFATGDPITSWSWNFGDASPTATASIQNPAHTYTSQNTYTVQLIANTANCSDTLLQNITINIKPTANFTLTPLNGCPTLTVDFSNSSSNAVSYSWNFGNGNTSLATNPLSTFTNTTTVNKTYTVTLTASTTAGCIDTYTANVTVFPKPVSSFTVNAATGCSPVAATFTNTSTGASAYRWTFGDASSSTATTSIISHTYVNSTLLIQTFTTQLVSISINGCKDSSYITVTTYPIPIFNFTMVPNYGCSPLNINFEPVPGAVAYEWNFGDNSPTDFSPTPIHVFTNTTTINKTYTVQLIASNAFSCSDTAYGYPLVFAQPFANFVVTPTVGCSPLITTFTNTSMAASTYLWKFGDGNSDVTFNTNHTYTNSSNTINQSYNCTLIALNSNGCIDSITKQVTVLNKPKANFTLDTPACSPKLLTFTNTSQGAVSYNWNFGTNTSINTNASIAFTNTTTTNITQTVQLIATSTNNCKDTIIVPVIVHPKPDFTIVAVPDSGCSPLIINLSAVFNVVNYQWSFGDGNISTATNPTNRYYNNSQATKTFSVQLIGSDGYGCLDTSLKIIKVFASPIALFQANPTLVYVPTAAVQLTNLSSGAVSYYWNFGDGNNSTQTNPSYTYLNVGEYQIFLVATNSNGCSDTFNLPTKIIAEIESTVEIPNAFSPNPNASNGGLFNATDINNDVFHPVLKGIDKYELNIFSRWGELLFVSKDITIGWDGYYKGTLCTQDIYVWKIIATTLDGKKINKTGDLLLLR